MPTKMARVCREKAVFVTLYVEKPRRRKRRVSSNQQHHHHLHHHHYVHYTREEVNEHKHGHGDANKGYNRRAELLRYSQRLKESAQPPASTPPSQPKLISYNNQQSKTQIVPVQRKTRDARTPTCLGNWKILIPNFFKSMTSFQAKKESKKKKKSGSTTMKAIMKSLEVQKKRGFISKLFSTLRKHR